MTDRDKLWTRPFIVLMGVNFCSALSFYLIMVKITEYAIDTYQVSASVGGTLITSYVISALLTRLLFGGKIDAWGVKRALVVGSAVNAASMVLYLVPMGFAPLLAVRIAHGFGFAIMSGSAAAGAALIIPRKRYGEGIGYYSMMQALATGVGPFVAILVTNAFGGYLPMFAIASVMACLALASLGLLDMPQPERGVRQDAADEAAEADDSRASGGREGSPAGGGSSVGHAHPRVRVGSLVQLSVVPLASVLLLVYLCYSGILSFITLYAASIGQSHAVSLYFVVYAVVILISRPPVGRRVDRSGENSIIYACFVSLILGMVVLSCATEGITLLVSAALVGFGIGATQSIVQAVIARDTPAEHMGRANSTFFMSMDLGSGVGPVIIGAGIPLIGYSGCYAALAVVALGAMVLYYFVHGRHRTAP